MTDNYWNGKRVLVTGSTGFLGKPLCMALKNAGASVLPVLRKEFDLRRKGIYLSRPPDVCFHLAADVGGIADNIARPAELFYNNVLINASVVDSLARTGVGKLIALGSSCAYPRDAPLPLVESDYLRGEPEPTNAPYAYSKRLLLSHLQAAHTQYDLNYTYLILANLYGEGCDTDPQRAHVIGALARKFYEAKRDGAGSVTLWGTGKPVRNFLHVDDAVESLLAAGEGTGETRVANICYEASDSIRSVATLIAKETEYQGMLIWDASKPDGQLWRVMDGRLASRFRPTIGVDFPDGIRRLVAWYASTQERVHA